jgi:hypothetical protein
VAARGAATLSGSSSVGRGGRSQVRGGRDDGVLAFGARGCVGSPLELVITFTTDLLLPASTRMYLLPAYLKRSRDHSVTDVASRLPSLLSFSTFIVQYVIYVPCPTVYFARRPPWN